MALVSSRKVREKRQIQFYERSTRTTRRYLQIGSRIRQDILKKKRADYGEKIISTLLIQLVKEFGNGFSHPNLFRMVRFAEVFPEGKINKKRGRRGRRLLDGRTEDDMSMIKVIFRHLLL